MATTLTARGGMVRSGGWTASLGAGAQGAVLAAQPVPAPNAEDKPGLPAGARVGTSPVELTLSRALPSGGADIVRALTAPVPAGQVASLAYWDSAGDGWVPVPTTLSADRRTLTAHVHHFTTWNDVYYLLGKFNGRTDPPGCLTPLPAWVDAADAFSDINAPGLFCAGHDPKDAAVLVVKVRNNRGYGMLARPSTTPEWAWSNIDAAAGLTAAATGFVISHVPGVSASVVTGARGAVYLPPGAEADFGFTETQVRAAPSRLVKLVRDPVYVAAGIIEHGMGIGGALDTADTSDAGTLSRAAGHVGALVAATDCIAAGAGSRSGDDAVRAILGCAASSPKAIEALVISVGVKMTRLKASPAVLGKLAARALIVGAAIAAAQSGFFIGEYVSDDQYGPGTWTISVTARHPQLTKFGSPGGVLITSMADTGKMPTTPYAFRKFIADQAAATLAPGNCIDGAGVNVYMYRSDGFASGALSACLGSGYAALWARADGRWKEIAGTQNAFDCAVLHRYRVPSVMAGHVCSDAGTFQEHPYSQS